MKEKLYTEAEVDQIIERCINANIDIKLFEKSRILKCPLCLINFAKINDYEWKPACRCYKENLRINVG